MIGRGKRQYKKPKPAPETQEPIKKKKTGLFMEEDDEQEMDFSMSRTSTIKQKKQPQQTTVDYVYFANSKPTFAARRNKAAAKAGTIVDASSFEQQRRRVGTVAVKKPIFEDSDEDDWAGGSGWSGST